MHSRKGFDWCWLNAQHSGFQFCLYGARKSRYLIPPLVDDVYATWDLSASAVLWLPWMIARLPSVILVSGCCTVNIVQKHFDIETQTEKISCMFWVWAVGSVKLCGAWMCLIRSRPRSFPGGSGYRALHLRCSWTDTNNLLQATCTTGRHFFLMVSKIRIFSSVRVAHGPLSDCLWSADCSTQYIRCWFNWTSHSGNIVLLKTCGTRISKQSS